MIDLWAWGFTTQSVAAAGIVQGSPPLAADGHAALQTVHLIDCSRRHVLTCLENVYVRRMSDRRLLAFLSRWPSSTISMPQWTCSPKTQKLQLP